MMNEINSTKIDIKSAIKSFQEVQVHLDQNKALPWNLGMECVKGAITHLNTLEAQSFVENYLLKVMVLMTQQNPSKFGVFEKNVIEESIYVSLKICLKLLPEIPSLLKLVIRLFDPKIPFYYGGKVGYTFSQGYPNVRISAAKKFVDLKGFHNVYEVLKKSECPWYGVDVFLHLLNILHIPEIIPLVDDQMKQSLLKLSMDKLLSMPDEQLKKENTDLLASLIHVIGTLSFSMARTTAQKRHEQFYSFWYQIIFKMVTSSSLVIKLFGLEQMNDLIVEAKSTRPLASNYLVCGAGTTYLNGVYNAVSKSSDAECMQYTKPIEGSNIPMLTLFRCTMRNTKSKWWFLSQADAEKPGTEKDVDYYLHKSNGPHEEREPSALGWVRSHSGMKIIGLDPPPILKRGPAIIPKGMTKDMFLDTLLLEWGNKTNLLALLFSPSSLHRETVVRSCKIVQFYAEYDALNTSHVQLLWKAALQCNDIDITEEVFSILVPLLSSLRPELLNSLLDSSIEALESEDNYQKVVAFAERLSDDSFRVISQLSTSLDSFSKILLMTWKLYTHPSAQISKSIHILEELISHCFEQEYGMEMALERIMEYNEKLLKLAETVDVKSGEVTGSVDEESASRIIHVLQFLVARVSTASEVLQRKVLIELNIPEVVIGEIFRFILTNRSLVKSGKLDEKWYLNHLSDRFQLLQKYHQGILLNLRSTNITYDGGLEGDYSFDSIEKLWQLVLPNHLELDQFFNFLKGDAALSLGNHIDSESNVAEEPIQIGIVRKNVLRSFEQFICNESVDWSQCGEEAFICFKEHYIQLESWPKYFSNDDPPPTNLGLLTLWNIALSTPVQSCVQNSIELLLQAYENTAATYEEGLRKFLDVAFQKLNECLESDTQHHTSRMSRLSLILSTGCQKYNNECTIPHAAASNTSRLRLNVYYRRVSYYYSQATQSDSMRVDMGSDGMVSIDVHPYYSVRWLKQKIIDSAGFGSGAKVTFDSFNDRALINNTIISELDLVDGQDINVSYEISFQHQRNFNDYYDSMNVKSFEAVSSGAVCSSIGYLISDDKYKFDTLLQLCGSTEDQQLSSQLWKLIQFIPTANHLMNKVTDACTLARENESSQLDHWLEIFRGTTTSLMAYLLQIIDIMLSPAAENDVLINKSAEFKTTFMRTGGPQAIQQVLLSFTCEDSVVSFSLLAVLLHILQVLFFEATADVDIQTNGTLATLSDEDSSRVLEKLLYGAYLAAVKADSSVVHDALVVITLLIKSPSVACKLTSNPYSRVLTTAAIRSPSKKVREMAAEFALQVGKNQEEVFNWLLDEISGVAIDVQNSDQYSELFSTINVLLKESCSDSIHLIHSTIRKQLVQVLEEKLLQFAVIKPSSEGNDNFLLIGHLSLLESLIELDFETVVSSNLGSNFVSLLLSDFLFALPTHDADDKSAICNTALARKAAFQVLSAFVSLSPAYFEQVLEEIVKLNKLAARQMYGIWGLQISHEIKQPDTRFTGLKNQGCTCYSNSLLQCLYMNKEFREAILSTPIPESFRTTLWHYDGIELVGKYVSFEWANGSWRVGKIVGYDGDTKCHRVQYERADGTMDESATFNIHEGRFQRETGRVKIVHLDEEDEDLEVSEREEAAYQVLEQLQRTFSFLKHSRRKYFDPRPLVEACKTLNLNFNVYHQNDAAEFCDQLLDRIETATKGKHSKRDIWNEELMKSVFGGKWLTEKIPQDCETYKGDKSQCGHWQSARTESFLKVELMIRGKENIDESLQELVQGELMDGDNKIQCDVCCEKKATTRRTCFGALPSTLILHLKRFDLDFQTFETVKLNNRMAFPTTINMIKYTKEGVDLDASNKEHENKDNDGLTYDESRTNDAKSRDDQCNPDEFLYELQGVLVHAGVAQGGHYYSFVRDSEHDDGHWFRFDDEDVTPFDHEQIPLQCFGGSSSTNTGHHTGSSLEDDRTSNALILFYKKAKSPVSAVSDERQSSTGSSNSRMVDGNRAFMREVNESNLQHLLSCFLMDAELHSFVRALLSSVAFASKSSPSSDSAEHTSNESALESFRPLKWKVEPSSNVCERTVQYGCSFLLDVVLHCRERPAVRSAVRILKNAFEACPKSATWFVNHALSPHSCTWMQDFLIHSTDALARATFVQLLVYAVSVIAPKDSDGLMPYITMKQADIRKELQSSKNNEQALCGILIKTVIEHVFKSVTHIRTADEVFVLIRDLAAVPAICKALQSIGIICFLSYFIVPDAVTPVIAAQFEKNINPARQQSIRHEFSHLLQSIFEAIAALLGVPQTRKVNLLQEKTFWEAELVPEAKDAFRVVFQESCRGSSNSMDFNDLSQYFERVCAVSGVKVHSAQVRAIIDRCGNRNDNRLYLEGFLQYQADTASYNPKQVWRDLCAFGYRNDLSRSINNSDVSTSSRVATNGTDVPPILPEHCKVCLSQLAFYEAGLSSSESSARAIAQRVCGSEEKITQNLISQALDKLLALVSENTWTPNPVILINDLLRLLLTIDEQHQINKLYHIMLHPNTGLVSVICNERQQPSNCRANEFNRLYVQDKYLGFVQDLVGISGVLQTLSKLAEREPKIRFVKGLLKLNPGSQLTEIEEIAVRTAVFVEGAGQVAVNGEYKFKDVKNNAGYYQRFGNYEDRQVRFTLYKCSLQNGGFQWFISVTPENLDPGTKHDTDFYYAPAKPNDRLPPTQWMKMNGNHTKDPSPKVRCDGHTILSEFSVHSVTDSTLLLGINSLSLSNSEVDNESSDSDKESLMRVGDDSGYEEFN